MYTCSTDKQTETHSGYSFLQFDILEMVSTLAMNVK